MANPTGQALWLELQRLGQRLRDLRVERNLTLDALAVQTGLSKAYLSRLEAGDRQASLEALLRLASAHQITLAALFSPAATAPLPGLVAISVGQPRPLNRSKTVLSGIAKTPVRTAVRLGQHGLEGDAQADREHHGGPDRAVCVYPLEHYPFWSTRLAKPLDFAAFGENFSVWGLTEASACIGDVYSVGTAVIQISTPRGTCEKLALRYREPRLESWVAQTGYTGFYCRVLESGQVQPGEPLRLLERSRQALTVAQANQSRAP